MITLTRHNRFVFFESHNPKELTLIKDSLTFYMEGAHFAQSYQDGHWDGYVKFYEKRINHFAYGFLDIIRKVLDEKEIPYEMIGFEYAFDVSIQLDEKFWQHQIEAVTQFLIFHHGIIEVPTRGGKTLIASECIRLTAFQDLNNCPVLFITDTELLFDQAIGDLAKNLKVPRKSIGFIKEGVVNLQGITVATVQSIQSILDAPKKLKNYKPRKNSTKIKSPEQLRFEIKEARELARLLTEYLRIVGFLVVDECHEYGGEKRIGLLEKIINFEYALFLSATPFKSETPFNNLNLMKVSGPILYKVPKQVLQERGVLAKDKVMLILMNHDTNRNVRINKSSTYTEFQREIITHNERRNTIVVNVTEICRKMKLKTLVLFVFKKHGSYIQSITGDIFLSGDDSLKYRVNVKNQFLKRKGGVLLASDIFKKGITLPEVQVLYNAGGGLEQSGLIQKSGRVLGVKGDKTKALVIDFVDNYHYFNEHSLSRIQVYEESMGIDNIVVYDSEDGDFYRDVREFLKNWFEQ